MSDQKKEPAEVVELMLGALAPPLREQLKGHRMGLPRTAVTHAQRDLDAISRLVVRDLIGAAEAHRLRMRVLNRLMGTVRAARR